MVTSGLKSVEMRVRSLDQVVQTTIGCSLRRAGDFCAKGFGICEQEHIRFNFFELLIQRCQVFEENLMKRAIEP